MLTINFEKLDKPSIIAVAADCRCLQLSATTIIVNEPLVEEHDKYFCVTEEAEVKFFDERRPHWLVDSCHHVGYIDSGCLLFLPDEWGFGNIGTWSMKLFDAMAQSQNHAMFAKIFSGLDHSNLICNVRDKLTEIETKL